ncbi:NACHT domain-containing protein [Frankia sp. AiPs1]|uniref:TIR domain-containing protein n=1 Tax=Frankia sp. AiPa1 TaxID=573492 RepID=UPI00202B34E7|nr:toll/interleukin-1 receptor domain-containing protein [Frankia sp. AiPa1]MCL9762742.1 toll/interleukin-1 receptor domain-containing protein [Frankia sp. AiPa1]
MDQGQEPAARTKPDFFISYAPPDEEHAEWIAWELEGAGYTVVIRAWDFVAGTHVIQEIHQAVQNATQTIAVLSVAYLTEAYVAAEWQAAFGDDPLGKQRKLLVVRVEGCDRPGLLRQLVCVDIFGLTARDARDQLLKAVRGDRRKPPRAPAFPSRRHGQVPDLREIADQLQVAVRRQWEDEAAIRRLNEPYPLPVSWQPADSDLTDDWETIIRLATTGAGWPITGGWAAGPAELAGSGRQLADVLDRVPTGRLVVLGESGSGKTMLAVRLVLDLLKHKSPEAPVPVLISLASWNPTETGLYSWLDQRLTLDYPGLRERAPDGSGASRARALLNAGMLLLLLDGLDEIADAARGHAIGRINDVLRPGQKLVLLSRSGPYRAATRPGDGPEVTLAGAAGISLCSLPATDVVDYLQRSAGGPTTAGRWELIRAALAAPTPPPVAEVLTSPLMAHLARTIYNPRIGEHGSSLPDPRSLLDPVQFPSRTAIEEHMFDGFLPAAYRKHERARPCPWLTVDAERWLAFLARHLEHTHHGSPDLAWWQIPEVISPKKRRFTIGPGVGLGAGLLCGIAFGLDGDLALRVAYVLYFWLFFGGAGTFFGGAKVPLPKLAVWWRVPRSRVVAALKPVRNAVLPFGIGFALLGGLGVGLELAGAPVKFGEGGTDGYESVLVLPLLVMVFLGLFLAPLSGAFEAMSADLTEAAGPTWVLRRDRAAFCSVVLTTGLGPVLVCWLTPGGFVCGLGLGLAVGLMFAIYQTSWGMFTLTRAWLAARGRLPRNLMAFLADAHEKRGVLRQSGAVYQFRHVELQRRLASSKDRTGRPFAGVE